MPLPTPNKDERGFVYKAFEAKLETVGEGERAVIAVVNTAAIDLDGELLLPSGCDLTAYRQNPIVPWAHMYRELPVAKAAPPGWIRFDKHLNAVKAKPIFADFEFADDIFKLYQGGFLRSFSVATDPSTADIIEPTQKDLSKHPEWAGARLVYRKWEMAEFSCCLMGINPEALAEAVSKAVIGIKTADALVAELADAEEGEVPKAPELIPEIITTKAPPPPPVRRLIQVPQVKITRRASWPKKIALTTVDTVAKMVRREIDRLRGRV